MDAEQKRDEEHFRQVEKALLYADDAARKIGRVADRLEADDCDPYLVAALRKSALAVRDEHGEMMKRVYWRAPSQGEQRDLLDGSEQERLAS